MDLRTYQTDVIHEARLAIGRYGARAVLIQAPTGSGKTVVAAQIIAQAETKESDVLFLAHRRELVYQCENKLKEFGVRPGLIMSGEFPDSWSRVQVASIDTLRVRAMERGVIKMPKAKLVFIDECHRALSATYLKLIAHYREQGAIIIGLTATPIRTDGRGMGQVFDKMVKCPSVAELIAMGYLVQPKYFAPSAPDLIGVKTTAGDYNQADLEKAMDKNELVGDIVTNWLRLAQGRPTIVFASGVQHSIHLRDEFLRVGVRAEHVDANTLPEIRQGVTQRLHSGQTQVVCNCMVFTEGYDEPSLSCAVLARPTKNLGLYLQMAGRVLRPFEGKSDTLIIDHGGLVYRHGFVEDPIDWTLDEGKLFADREHSMQERGEQTPITCVKCSHVYSGQARCPRCGHTPERKGRWVETRNADLVQLRAGDRKPKKKVWTDEEKAMWWGMLTHYAESHGHKPGWIYHKYKAKIGVGPGPAVRYAIPKLPTPECRAWIRSTQIHYAKSKDKAAKVPTDKFTGLPIS